MHWRPRSGCAASPCSCAALPGFARSERLKKSHERNVLRQQDSSGPEPGVAPGRPVRARHGRAAARGAAARPRTPPSGPSPRASLGRRPARQVRRLERRFAARARADRRACHRRGGDLQLAAEPARRRARGDRRAAADRRPADRRVPRPRLPELAEALDRGAVMLPAALRALLVLALCTAFGAGAQAPKKKDSRPAWAQLTAEQQNVLAPLKSDWDTLEPERRRKWIGIAKRYPTMKPEQQARVQRRMERWTKLTPEQRRQARENYKRMAKARADKRERLVNAWTEYQALPPEERQPLAPPSPQGPPKARQ